MEPFLAPPPALVCPKSPDHLPCRLLQGRKKKIEIPSAIGSPGEPLFFQVSTFWELPLSVRPFRVLCSSVCGMHRNTLAANRKGRSLILLRFRYVRLPLIPLQLTVNVFLELHAQTRREARNSERANRKEQENEKLHLQKRKARPSRKSCRILKELIFGFGEPIIQPRI